MVVEELEINIKAAQRIDWLAAIHFHGMKYGKQGKFLITRNGKWLSTVSPRKVALSSKTSTGTAKHYSAMAMAESTSRHSRHGSRGTTFVMTCFRGWSR